MSRVPNGCRSGAERVREMNSVGRQHDVVATTVVADWNADPLELIDVLLPNRVGMNLATKPTANSRCQLVGRASRRVRLAKLLVHHPSSLVNSARRRWESRRRAEEFGPKSHNVTGPEVDDLDCSLGWSPLIVKQATLSG